MSAVINTNVRSMFASAALATNERQMGVAMNQLSTGKRTYSASVDAAGLALADKLTSQIRGTQMAVQNINDGISFMQTAEGALNEITNMGQRMYELAVQLENASLFDDDQEASIEAEMDDLGAAIDDIIANTKWNGVTTADFDIDVTVTGDSDATAANFKATVLGTTTPTSASGKDDIATYLATVATQRGEAGSFINRLGYMADNLTNLAANLSASRSRTQDTDYAAASAELARTQIVSQAATAMLAQANQSSQSVLSLLK
jgi:flagellin